MSKLKEKSEIQLSKLRSMLSAGEGREMEKTIRARFSNGVIEPLEDLTIKEGKELISAVSEAPAGSEKTLEALRKSFGGWKGLIDAEELKRNIYNDRLINTRPVPKL